MKSRATLVYMAINYAILAAIVYCIYKKWFARRSSWEGFCADDEIANSGACAKKCSMGNYNPVTKACY